MYLRFVHFNTTNILFLYLIKQIQKTYDLRYHLVSKKHYFLNQYIQND